MPSMTEKLWRILRDTNEILNDTAYDIGRYTVNDSNGQAAAEGYYLVIFRRENDEWKIHRQIDNLIMPEQGQPGGQGQTGGGN